MSSRNAEIFCTAEPLLQSVDQKGKTVKRQFDCSVPLGETDAQHLKVAAKGSMDQLERMDAVGACCRGESQQHAIAHRLRKQCFDCSKQSVTIRILLLKETDRRRRHSNPAPMSPAVHSLNVCC